MLHGNDRFRSVFLLFLYTLAGSLPMLYDIILSEPSMSFYPSHDLWPYQTPNSKSKIRK